MFSSERLKGIDVFVCVADLGSFTLTAERLNLTNSAVSKSIARLESRLKVLLFQRTTRRLALTEAGVAFYRTCTKVLADLEEVELSMQTEDAEAGGKVRIDLPAAYGRLHALPAILQCLAAHPQLQPHISFSDRFVDPLQEGIDILVRIGGSGNWPDGLGQRHLGTPRHIFCASPAYLDQHGVPQVERDLEHHRCVVYAESDGTTSPWYFSGERPGDRERRVLPGRIAAGDGEAQVIAVLAGHGIAQLPTWLVGRHIQDGSLVEVLPACAVDGLPIHLAWVKRRQNLPKVRVLLDMLTARLTLPVHQAADGRPAAA